MSALVIRSVRDAARKLAEIKFKLRLGGQLLKLELVQTRSPFWSLVLNGIQPTQTTISEGCRPCRDAVASANVGLETDPASYRERGLIQRLVAHQSRSKSAR